MPKKMETRRFFAKKTNKETKSFSTFKCREAKIAGDIFMYLKRKAV